MHLPENPIPVAISAEVVSPTHTALEFACRPYFAIAARDGRTWLEANVNLSAGRALLDAHTYVDVCLASLSIAEDGVFSRWMLTRNKKIVKTTFLGRPPRETLVTGISATPIRSIAARPSDVVSLIRTLLGMCARDDALLTAMTIYASASSLLHAQFIREASIDYFAVVETLATSTRPLMRGKSVYQWRDIEAALIQLSVPSTSRKRVRQAYGMRGDLAHGHPKQLHLAQHAAGTQATASVATPEPALLCKTAADIMIRAYAGFSG